MEYLMAGLTPQAFAAALPITVFAGFVKGAVGFAMPMIMISAFSSFLPPETALAGLILPTLISNLTQAFRHGLEPGMANRHHLPPHADRHRDLHRDLGAIRPHHPARPVPAAAGPADHRLCGAATGRRRPCAAAGAPQPRRVDSGRQSAGFTAGVSGVWGPPLLVYLLSIKADKLETVRVQGVVFLIGAVVLLVAHLHSGVLTASTHRVFCRLGAARDDRPKPWRRDARPPRSVKVPPLDADSAGADRPEPDAPRGWPLIAKP